jgi:hypothetical protein
VPAVVDESLRSFEDPATRARLARIVGSPEIQQAIEETSQALVVGVLGADVGERGRAVAAALTAGIADALAEAIREKLVPAAAAGLRTTLSAISEEDKRTLQRALAESVREATLAALRTTAHQLPGAIGPSLRSAMTESLSAPDLRASVSGLASDATRSALLSSRDVLLQLHEDNDVFGAAIIDHLLDRLRSLLVVAIVATFASGVLVGVLGIAFARRRRPRPAGPTVE